MTIQLYDPVYPVFLPKSLEPLVNDGVNILFLEIHPSKRLHLIIEYREEEKERKICTWRKVHNINIKTVKN